MGNNFELVLQLLALTTKIKQKMCMLISGIHLNHFRFDQRRETMKAIQTKNLLLRVNLPQFWELVKLSI